MKLFFEDIRSMNEYVSSAMKDVYESKKKQLSDIIYKEVKGIIKDYTQNVRELPLAFPTVEVTINGYKARVFLETGSSYRYDMYRSDAVAITKEIAKRFDGRIVSDFLVEFQTNFYSYETFCNMIISKLADELISDNIKDLLI